MSIANIVCSNCGKEYIWQQQLAGHTVRCTCGQVMPVPSMAPQTDSVYALAPSEDAKPLQRTARSNLDDSQFQLPCPACGQPIEFGGVVCTACGYNVKTGEHMPRKPSVPIQLGTAEQVIAPAPILNVPPYAVPSAPTRNAREETRRDVIMRYVGIVAVLLLLIAIVFATKRFTASKPVGTENLTPDDAAIFEKLQGGAALEAREWLEKDPQRMLGAYNARQGTAKVEEMYRNGAAKVTCLAGRFVMAVVVELPAKREDRKKFFDWQKEHHESIGETVTTDSGQKYLYITLPR